MAQILSPVLPDAVLNFQTTRSAFLIGYGDRSRRSSYRLPTGSGYGRRRCGPRRGRLQVVSVAEAGDATALDDVADDYYAVLGLLPDATPQQIKKAYYNCMKACHPDLTGNDEETNNFCMFINEVYEVLSDPVQRMVYDEIHGYTATATNPFLDVNSPKDHVFVDEFSCIGCKNCANLAPDIFKIEEDFGRARVCRQSGNSDIVQQAIESCPVDCIHWTSAAQISLLEDEMRRVEIINIAYMLAGARATSDVFRMASSRWEKRQSKVLEKARMRMTKEETNYKGSYWNDLWGKQKDYETTDEELKERTKRAAAAARRWREYSRAGADRPPTFKLPEATPSEDR